MGARQKLNAVYIYADLIVAAILGLAMQSWLMFLGSAVVMVAASVHTGGIRDQPTSRHPKRGRG